MAGMDFAPDYTARYRIKYNDGQASHTQTWRYPGNGDGPELTAVSTAVGDFYSNIEAGLWNDFVILSASFCLKDSSIFLPITPTPVVTGAQDPTGNRTRRHKANALSFVGRTALGGRVVFYQYGYWKAVGDDPDEDDFRFQPGEESPIDVAIGSLIGSGASLCGNDGAAIAWYPYANAKYNDYWLGKVRNG